MGGWFGDCGGGVAGGLSGFKREVKRYEREWDIILIRDRSWQN